MEIKESTINELLDAMWFNFSPYLFYHGEGTNCFDQHETDKDWIFDLVKAYNSLLDDLGGEHGMHNKIVISF